MSNAYKSHYGWQADSNVELFEGKVLNVVTMKRFSGKLVTTVKAGTVTADGLGISYMMYQDFGAELISEKPSRVSEKVVNAQHALALANMADVIAQAKAFYGKV